MSTSSAPSGDNGTATEEGTSFATPQVTGTIVLLQQMYRKAYGTLPTVAQLDGWLQAGPTPIHDAATGIDIGRLNVAGSLKLLEGQIQATASANAVVNAIPTIPAVVPLVATSPVTPPTVVTPPTTSVPSDTTTVIKTTTTADQPMTEVIVNGVVGRERRHFAARGDVLSVVCADEWRVQEPPGLDFAWFQHQPWRRQADRHGDAPEDGRNRDSRRVKVVLQADANRLGRGRPLGRRSPEPRSDPKPQAGAHFGSSASTASLFLDGPRPTMIDGSGRKRYRVDEGEHRWRTHRNLEVQW